MSFTKGQKVKFTTTKGRSGSGTVEQVRDTDRGQWIDVKEDSGKLISVRPSLVSEG